MHGNEPLGVNLVYELKSNPIPNVDALIANKYAVKKNCRFIKQDLNRAFPGDLKSDDYETKRACQLLLLVKKYDLVLDFHNTYTSNNDCVFVGKNAPNFLYRASAALGLKRVIVADYDCINKYAKNCLSVEISLDSDLMDLKIWYQKIMLLSRSQKIDLPKAEVEKYKFVYRITTAKRDELNLRSQNLEAFKKISRKLTKDLGQKGELYPIFIGDGYTPYNYGGLIKKSKGRLKNSR